MIRRRSWSKTIQSWSERMVVIAGVIGIGWIVYIIATSPPPYMDDTPLAPTVCLDDDISDVYVNPDFTPWDELFPEGHEYGKDGEVISQGADGMPFSERAAPPMARIPWPYGGRIQDRSTGKHGCGAPSVVSEPKSWHLIIIGLLSFAVWRWVGK